MESFESRRNHFEDWSDIVGGGENNEVVVETEEWRWKEKPLTGVLPREKSGPLKERPETEEARLRD